MYQSIYYKPSTKECFIRDDEEGFYMFNWEPYAYKVDSVGEYKTMFGQNVSKVSLETYGDKYLIESDVPNTTRILIDKYYDSVDVPKNHRYVYFDIECEMHSGMPNVMEPKNTITSIALYDASDKKYTVFVLDKKNLATEREGLVSCQTESELLTRFLRKWNEIDPTVITGWNVDGFDVPYLYNRIKKVLGANAARSLSPIKEVYFDKRNSRYTLGGISCLDYIRLYKKYTEGEKSSYTLDNIAKDEIGEGKVEYDGNLDTFMKTDLDGFIEYNITDVRLVVKLEEKLKFLELIISVSHFSHVAYEDAFFSSRALEGAILTELKRRGLVSINKPRNRPDFISPEDGGADGEESSFIGAIVKPPLPGRYKWIYDLDLASLYPSTMMTLNISPETKIGKFYGWSSEDWAANKDMECRLGRDMFHREELVDLFQNKVSVAANGTLYDMENVGIFNGILQDWYSKRLEYKKLMKKYGDEKNTEQYEYYKWRQWVQKIILNSFYGVLGLKSFRFYDIDNAEAITTTGRLVIQTTIDVLNAKYNKELGLPKGTDHVIASDTDSAFLSCLELVTHRNPEIDVNDEDAMGEQIQKIANEMQLYVNEFYSVMAKRFFNCDSHRFEIKQELVASAAFFMEAKKRRAIKVKLNNGVKVDEVIYTGVDIVRSSFPKGYVSHMKDVLNAIIDFKDKDVLDDMVLSFKDGNSNISYMDIGTSSSVRNLDVFEKESLELPIGKFPKGATAHVKAAIAYNKLLKYYKCPAKYAPIRQGEKMKWVYLKENPFGLETVAFKGYSDPPEVIKFIQDNLDNEKMYNSNLINKIHTFWDALGWEYPTRKDKIIESYFTF